MIGRVYRWRGGFWRVVTRGEPFDKGPRRNVLIERVTEGFRVFSGVPGRPETQTRPGYSRLHVDPDRRCWTRTGEYVVRPFRGLRRA